MTFLCVKNRGLNYGLFIEETRFLDTGRLFYKRFLIIDIITPQNTKKTLNSQRLPYLNNHIIYKIV